MRYSISNTAEYGDLTRGPRIINKNVKKEMKKILEEIQTGKFVRDWILECKSGQLNYKAEKRLQSEDRAHRIGQTNKVTYIDLICENTYQSSVAICTLLSRYFSACCGVLSNTLGSSNVMGMRFSAPGTKGQASLAESQVMMAPKPELGLKASSIFLENPITGWAFSAYLIA